MKQRAIIWDLGGVLTEVDRKRYAYCIGFRYFLRCIALDWKIPYDCTNRAFELLNRIVISEDLSTAYMPGEMVMPPVMVAYQAGLLNSEQIRILLKEEMVKAYEEGFFRSYSEKLLLERITDELFNPQALLFSYYLISQGVSLIHSLAAQKLADGRPRYRLYVLSNWDVASFQLIYKRSHHFFSSFDGIAVSGQIGFVKPSPALFEHIIKRYNIDKESCIFIDDQKENIEAARAYGIGTALLFKNFEQLKRDLSACGIHKE